jgi:hypothetical protein
MDNQEILTKAIQKAIDGGWRSKHLNRLQLFDKTKMTTAVKQELVASLLFNHDFAKALWGDGGRIKKPVDYPNYSAKTRSVKIRGWQSHLQQMVIADDPIKYLGENI